MQIQTKKHIDCFFLGFSKVMLQHNLLTGFLFLAGIFFNSWHMGIGAVLGLLVSTVSAQILRYDKSAIETGLYGFNGVLVGTATVFFFGLGPAAITALVIGSILSSLIMNQFEKKTLLPYTAPFVLSTWTAMLLLMLWQITPIAASTSPATTSWEVITSLSTAFGQIIFQNNGVTGALFFIGILVASRRAAAYALGGAIFATLIALFLAFPMNAINTGIFGFNAILCSIAFSNQKQWGPAKAGAAVVLSVFFTYGMIMVGIPTLTAPFVLVTWAVQAAETGGQN